MKPSFFPGMLTLQAIHEAEYQVCLQGNEILRTRSQKAALAKCNEIRRQMEKQFPERKLTDEDKSEVLRRNVADSLVGHNSIGGRKRKTTARSTRTFGG